VLPPLLAVLLLLNFPLRNSRKWQSLLAREERRWTLLLILSRRHPSDFGILYFPLPNHSKKRRQIFSPQPRLSLVKLIVEEIE
jgi:hypothetical protein